MIAVVRQWVGKPRGVAPGTLTVANENSASPIPKNVMSSRCITGKDMSKNGQTDFWNSIKFIQMQPYLRLPNETFWDGVLESKSALKRARSAATFLEMLSFLFPCSPPTNLGTGVLLQDWWRSSALDWAAGFYWSTVFGRTLRLSTSSWKNLPRILNPVFPTECVFLIHCFSSHGKCPSFRPPDRPTICRTQRHGSNPRASSGTCRRSESGRIESSKWANGSVTWLVGVGWNDNFFLSQKT